MSKPAVWWVREKNVHIWLPWVTRYSLRHLEKKGTLKVYVGWPMRGDIWRRQAGAPRWYSVNKLDELFCKMATDESKQGERNGN